jgi:NADH-quinone oxidoreductase subunit D
MTDESVGTVYVAQGGDWDEIVRAQADRGDETIVINMGPQHPSTHGVLRLILEIDGETVTSPVPASASCTPASRRTWSTAPGRRASTFVTRMDYVAPIFNEVGLLPGRREAARHRPTRSPSGRRHPRADHGAQPDRLPPGRARHRRHGDGRALTMMTIGFREREMILDFFEPSPACA